MRGKSALRGFKRIIWIFCATGKSSHFRPLQLKAFSKINFILEFAYHVIFIKWEIMDLHLAFLILFLQKEDRTFSLKYSGNSYGPCKEWKKKFLSHALRFFLAHVRVPIFLPSYKNPHGLKNQRCSRVAALRAGKERRKERIGPRSKGKTTLVRERSFQKDKKFVKKKDLLYMHIFS